MMSRRELVGAAGAVLLPLQDMKPLPPSERFGLAVCGLGDYALTRIIPAIAESKTVRLAAVITGDAEKGRDVMRRNGGDPRRVYGYDEMEKMPKEVEGVYVITPNGLHRRDVEAAAKARRHVLCEKPMATSVADGEAMIEACRSAGVRLMVGYRAHFEPHNRRAMDLTQTGALGRLVSLTGDHGRILNPAEKRDQWRMDKVLAGGGSLMDIGIYSVNGMLYLSNEQPTEVMASVSTPANNPRFAKGVEDTVHWQFRFPSGVLANGSSSYSWVGKKTLGAVGDKMRLDLDPATEYEGNRLFLTNDEGRREVKVEAASQFVGQLDHFVQAVRENRPFRTPGEMGLRDLRLLISIYEAAAAGRTVKLAA